MCLGFEPGTTLEEGLKAQMNPLSFGGPLLVKLLTHKQKRDSIRVKYVDKVSKENGPKTIFSETQTFPTECHVKINQVLQSPLQSYVWVCLPAVEFPLTTLTSVNGSLSISVCLSTSASTHVFVYLRIYSSNSVYVHASNAQVDYYI